MRKDWEDIAFKSIKVNGRPLEYCVDYVESTGWALALATYWTGEFKGQPVPAPGTIYGYELIEVRGKIEVFHEEKEPEPEINWQPWSEWGRVDTALPVDISIVASICVEIQWSDDGISPAVERTEYYSPEPTYRKFQIPTGGQWMRYRDSYCE